MTVFSYPMLAWRGGKVNFPFVPCALPGARSGRVEFLQTVPERPEGKLQELRRLGFDPARLFQRPLEQRFFRVSQHGLEVQALVGNVQLSEFGAGRHVSCAPRYV